MIRERYAELTGLPVVSITGGTYTGVAATWARRLLDPGVAFIVELGPTLSDAEADTHARGGADDRRRIQLIVAATQRTTRPKALDRWPRRVYRESENDDVGEVP